MTDRKLKSALHGMAKPRAIAIEVLNRWDPKKNYAGTILDSLRHLTDQSQRATDLVFGTLRNRTAIDTVIATFSGRPVKRIQHKLLNIIRVGTYELIYCPSTEQYAVVNEAVAGAKTTWPAKQSGFVNAVLRQITRHIKNRSLNLKPCPERSRRIKTKNLKFDDAKCTLVTDAVTGCQFDTDFLPDRWINPTEYLSTVFSLPEWLVAGWLAEFGEESTLQICLASNRRPSIYLRLNTLKTTMGILAEKLREAGIELEVNADDSVIRIISPRDVTRLPGFIEGLFTVQDITASKPVRNLEFRMKNEEFSIPNSQFSILDLCAAPGTKTTQLAEKTGDSARIIATDIDSRRLEMVRENIARLGINSVDIIPYDQIVNSQFSIQSSKFDCVLLDVPCSNTGVLARRVEARYRINPGMIKKLTGIQSDLLGTAADMLKTGGKICYSTCSIQSCENSVLIEDFLKKNQNFTLESEQLTLPSAEGFDHDGGYAAILVKQERN